MQTNPPIGYGTQGSGPHHAPAHIWDYWAIVMKRILLVIAFGMACVGAAYVVTQRQQKVYRATARVQILPPRSGGGAVEMFAPMISSDETYLNTQLEVLRTPDMIASAVRDANLAALPAFTGKSPDEIVRMTVGHVECSRLRGLYLVDVSVTGHDPKVLHHLANALVRTFAANQKSEAKKARDARKAVLESKIVSAEASVKFALNDKASHLRNANFSPTTFEYEYRKIHESLVRLSEERDRVITDILRAEPTVAAFTEALKKDPDKGYESLAQHPSIVFNSRLKEVDNRIAVLKDEQNRLMKDNVGRQHPNFLAQEGNIERAGRERMNVLREVVTTFLLEHDKNVAFRASLEKQIQLRDTELKSAVDVKNAIDKIDEDIEYWKGARDDAKKEKELITQNEIDEKEAVKIEQAAIEPTSPFSPNPTTNLTLGLVFGIVGGIALAFLLDYLDDTIRTKDELAKIAPDVPLLGVVPTIEARKSEVAKKDLFAANQPKSTISEAYRGVRTALTLSSRGPMQKVMLLTSAGPREGKTTTAINVATVLAFSGARTLVIDADLRKPRIHASFNLPNKKGLTNLIVGEDDPGEYCQRSHIDRVDVLTSGPIPPNPSELLGRPRMREILRKLRERYDQIVVDTPPIGAVTDAAVLATMADGVVLVVHAGKTRRQIVSRSIEQLRYINVPIVGVILNNLHLGRGRYYPGYYHYYYYYASHYGAEDGKSKKAKAAEKAESKEDDAAVS